MYVLAYQSIKPALAVFFSFFFFFFFFYLSLCSYYVIM